MQESCCGCERGYLDGFLQRPHLRAIELNNPEGCPSRLHVLQ